MCTCGVGVVCVHVVLVLCVYMWCWCCVCTCGVGVVCVHVVLCVVCTCGVVCCVYMWLCGVGVVCVHVVLVLCVYMWCCVLCVHVVVWCWCCVCICGVGVVCVHVVLCVVVYMWCVVKLGTRKNPPCVRSKRLRVYGQDVSVCTGNRPACRRIKCGLLHGTKGNGLCATTVLSTTWTCTTTTLGGVTPPWAGGVTPPSVVHVHEPRVPRSVAPGKAECAPAACHDDRLDHGHCHQLFCRLRHRIVEKREDGCRTGTRSDRQVTLPTKNGHAPRDPLNQERAINLSILAMSQPGKFSRVESN